MMKGNSKNDEFKDFRPAGDVQDQNPGPMSADGVRASDLPTYDPFEATNRSRFEKELQTLRNTPDWDTPSWNPTRADLFGKVVVVYIRRIFPELDFVHLWEKTVSKAQRRMKLTLRTRNYGQVSVEVPWDVINDDRCPDDLPIEVAKVAVERVRNNMSIIKAEIMAMEEKRAKDMAEALGLKSESDPTPSPDPDVSQDPQPELPEHLRVEDETMLPQEPVKEPRKKPEFLLPPEMFAEKRSLVYASGEILEGISLEPEPLPVVVDEPPAVEEITDFAQIVSLDDSAQKALAAMYEKELSECGAMLTEEEPPQSEPPQPSSAKKKKKKK